jgi:hypothetical protein
MVTSRGPHSAPLLQLPAPQAQHCCLSCRIACSCQSHCPLLPLYYLCSCSMPRQQRFGQGSPLRFPKCYQHTILHWCWPCCCHLSDHPLPLLPLTAPLSDPMPSTADFSVAASTTIISTDQTAPAAATLQTSFLHSLTNSGASGALRAPPPVPLQSIKQLLPPAVLLLLP